MTGHETIKADGSHEYNGVTFVTTNKQLFSNINTMQTKKVKVMKCTPSFAWYKNLIGKIFETYILKGVYFLKRDIENDEPIIKGILQEDAQEQFI